MTGFSKAFWDKEKVFKRLASVNSKAISNYNHKLLSALSLIGGFLMLIPLLASTFDESKQVAIFEYLISSFFAFTIFFLFRFPSMRKYSLGGLYLFFSFLFLLAIDLSIIHSPDMRATILLGAFCIIPLGLIDRPARVNFFVAFWFAAHTILSFYFKPQYVFDDLLNCLCFAILGCFIGDQMIWGRIEGYEAERLLTIKNETDMLTGVFSRRKLFETLAVLEKANAEKPSVILMIDIDYFKNYNDQYGHAAGDKCLNLLGEVFNNLSQKYRIHFYRYGGDEFVAMAYGYGRQELLSLAENLRIAVQNTDIDGHIITVSIGVSYCGDEQVRNYENVIDRADKAAYAAKRAGRNQVSIEEC